MKEVKTSLNQFFILFFNFISLQRISFHGQKLINLQKNFKMIKNRNSKTNLIK